MPKPSASNAPRPSVLNRGAEFIRADLQIHTPIDNRFKLPNGFNVETEEGRKEIGNAYIAGATENGVRIIAITEHNDLTFFPYIRDAATGSDIVVFPGVELTMDGGFHLIALFEPDADVDRLWEFLIQLGLGRDPKQRFFDDATPRKISGSTDDFFARVAMYGGIVIAPHVCSDAGILKNLKGQTRIEKWKMPQILAADPGGGRLVSELSPMEQNVFSNDYEQFKRSKKISRVWTSDARSFSEIGKCSTFIKVSSFSIEGLRQTFLDPDSRIRHPSEMIKRTCPVITSIAWEGSGFLSDERVEFNDGLNCLIGGKGVGKSSVIETLRYAFDIPAPSENQKQVSAHLKAVLPNDGTVRVTVRRGDPPEEFIIERTQGYSPVVSDVTGEILSDLEPTDLLRPSVYGQKEIYLIAQSQPDQLRVLDEFLAADLQEVEHEITRILRELSGNFDELSATREELEDVEEKLTQLPKLELFTRKYNELGIAEKLKEKTKHREGAQIVSRVKQRLEKYMAWLDNLQNPLSEETGVEPGHPLADLVGAANNNVVDSRSELAAAIGVLRENAVARTAAVATIVEEAKERSRSFDESFAETEARIQQEVPSMNVAEYLSAEARVAELLPLRREVDLQRARIAQLEKSRQALLAKLLTARRSRYQLRVRKAKEITAFLSGVLRVNIVFEGGKKEVRAILEGLKTGVRGVTLDELVSSDDFNLPSFVRAARAGASEVRARFPFLTDSSASTLARIDAADLAKLEVADLKDAISIEFNVGTAAAPQYRALTELSVGQKSTAVLLLLLLKDDHPFVVDQPEDALDNRFIYEDVVRRLRSAKEGRQFVIATHNANIPVLGDAEQIVVLSADGQAATIERTGSIDDDAIKGFVKHILEGGEGAFALRREKYGF